MSPQCSAWCAKEKFSSYLGGETVMNNQEPNPQGVRSGRLCQPYVRGGARSGCRHRPPRHRAGNTQCRRHRLQVQAPVRLTCPTTTDNQPVLNLELRERVGGGKTASGGQGEVGFTCTGETQTLVFTIPVSAKSERPNFRVGKATAIAILNACRADSTECTTVERTEEIKFKK